MGGSPLWLSGGYGGPLGKARGLHGVQCLSGVLGWGPCPPTSLGSKTEGSVCSRFHQGVRWALSGGGGGFKGGLYSPHPPCKRRDIMLVTPLPHAGLPLCLRKWPQGWPESSLKCGNPHRPPCLPIPKTALGSRGCCCSSASGRGSGPSRLPGGGGTVPSSSSPRFSPALFCCSVSTWGQ